MQSPEIESIFDATGRMATAGWRDHDVLPLADRWHRLIFLAADRGRALRIIDQRSRSAVGWPELHRQLSHNRFRCRGNQDQSE